MNNLFKKNQKGFTLVEIIVSLAIFSIVAVVALGSLMKIISANRKAQSIQSAITNINFALDSMSRELRVGSKYYCDTSPPPQVSNPTYKSCGYSNNGNDVTIYFKSSKSSGSGLNICNLVYAYKFSESVDRDIDGNTVYTVSKAQQNSCNDTNPQFTPLISDNVNITNYSINVSSQDDTNHPFPMVVLNLSGYSGVRQKDRTYFNVQTAVSPRTP